nr:hypothetical protein [Methyloferula stellata]
MVVLHAMMKLFQKKRFCLDRFAQFLQSSAHMIFLSFACRNIAQDQNTDPSLILTSGGNRGFGEKLLPVTSLSDDLRSLIENEGLRAKWLHCLRLPGCLRGRNQRAESPARDLLGSIAEQFFGLMIDENDFVRIAGNDDRICDEVEKPGGQIALHSLASVGRNRKQRADLRRHKV